MSGLSRKVVWLTGASSGIGEALAFELGRRGAHVVLSARRAEQLEEIAEKIAAAGGHAAVFVLDVTDSNAVSETAHAIRKQFGKIDTFIANAGTYLPTEVQKFSHIDEVRMMDLNYGAMVSGIEAVLPDMIAKRSGHVVGVASLSGYRGLPRSAGYSASKAAMIHFLESLRFDVEKFRILVTVVNPGFVKTPLTDKNDFPMPFLVSPERAAVIIADGIERGKCEVHFPWTFSWLMKLLRVVPYPLYHLLVRKFAVR